MKIQQCLMFRLGVIAKRNQTSGSFSRASTWLVLLLFATGWTQLSSIYAQTEQIDPVETWAVAATITNGKYTGSGIYLTPDFVITAAHVTAGWTGDLRVQIADTDLPATLVKQGRFEDVDLSLFSVDRQKLPASIEGIQASLCAAPAWSGDPVVIVDQGWVTQSRIISPMILPYPQRSKFATLIADVETTGNSGSGVFDPAHQCLLGIMSRKFMSVGVNLAKYFVPASEIREFIPAELRDKVLMK